MSGYFLVLAAAVMWGVLGPVSKMVFSQGVTPLETAFWRAALSWFFFAGHALALRRVRLAPRDLPVALLFGLIGISIFFASYQLAIQDLGAAPASVLLYTAPAWVAVMARLMLKENMSMAKIIAVSMTILGVAGVSFGQGGSASGFSLMGALLGLTAGFTYALYYIFGKLYLGRYETPTLFLYVLPVGALGLLPFIDFQPKNGTAWLGLFILAGVSTYGAYSVYYAGLRRLEATRAAVVATLEPVVAAVTAYFWWDERFDLAGYAGSALILLAVLVIVMDAPRKTAPTDAAVQAPSSP